MLVCSFVYDYFVFWWILTLWISLVFPAFPPLWSSWLFHLLSECIRSEMVCDDIEACVRAAAPLGFQAPAHLERAHGCMLIHLTTSLFCTLSALQHSLLWSNVIKLRSLDIPVVCFAFILGRRAEMSNSVTNIYTEKKN